MAICAFSVGKVCKDLKAAVDRDTTVLAATRLMRGLQVDCLVVTERSNGNSLSVGTVTAGDIVTRVTALGLDPNVLTVGDISWPAPGETAEASRARDLLALLRLSANGALAVIEHDGEIVGILPVKKLIPALVDQLECAERTTHGTTVSAGGATTHVDVALPNEDHLETFPASNPTAPAIHAATARWAVPHRPTNEPARRAEQ